MLERTIEFIDHNKLFADSDRLLLTVSGGIDSMVMLDLFTRLPYSISVAHCNFSLRGKESDGDQELVESYCSEKGINFYTKTFDTEEYARENGISIQMAARKLRYDWFEEVRSENGLDTIVLAHNKDDIIETFLVNLARGTGIQGLTGIKPRNKNLTRPLLFATRDEISTYSNKHGISFREDSSNIETKYKRNAIRHRIIPQFKELNPSFLSSMEGTIKKLEEATFLVSENISLTRDKIFFAADNGIQADVSALNMLEPLDIHLYELFKDYGIGQGNLDELKKLLHAPSGKHIDTNSHSIFKDRECLIITNKEKEGTEEEIIDLLDDLKAYRAEVLPADKVNISTDSNIAYLDYDKITFPITVRCWKKGDWFYPFGMKGKKKLSDFFVDHKIPLNQKDKIKLFISDENIFWVAGYRIDMRYAVSATTRQVMVIYASQ